jgi:N-acetylglucosaminyldiphosphoundecaprenol N-acetyl-beta-D-mannosaminyltransferase
LSSPRRIRIGHLSVDAVSFKGALDAVEALVLAKQGGTVFTPNVDHVVTAEDDAAFRDAYARADLCLADGMPLVWVSRLLGTPLPERIPGSDLVWPLVTRAAQTGWRTYLVGGLPGAASHAAARFDRELGATIAGVDESVIRLDDKAGLEQVAARVRSARPDLVLVALGSPKQELCIDRIRDCVGPAVLLGVGASLDFIAGKVQRAPPWMARAGFEWLFRLVQEPRRLAYRYLIKDPRFLAVVARTIVERARHRDGGGEGKP